MSGHLYQLWEDQFYRLNPPHYIHLDGPWDTYGVINGKQQENGTWLIRGLGKTLPRGVTDPKAGKTRRCL